MRKAHLITCPSYVEYDTFITEGYAGLHPIPVADDKKVTTRVLGTKITTNWDIIADLKRVKPDDYIFLHVRGDLIYGPFLAASYFLESPDMPSNFKSINLNIEYWSKHYEDQEFDEKFPWRVSIKSIDGVTKKAGFNSMELFKLKTIGLIQSLPERFLYHDKAKIVKPLLNHETGIVLRLLSELPSEFISVTPNPLKDFNTIMLNLKSYDGEVYREKILEAWLMENITYNGTNRAQYDNLINIFSEVQHFVNSIFTYYANFMDVLFYNEMHPPVEEYCAECGKYSSKNKSDLAVIELKKGDVDASVINQIREYGDWALKSLANNDNSKITLYIIGAWFDETVLSNNDIVCIRYSILDAPPFLRLERIN